MSNILYKWISNQAYGRKMVFENEPVSVKFPCSKCGTNRPTQLNINGSLEVGSCPCRTGKEE